MPYSFASDATFNDAMSRVASTSASFADVWPLIRTAVISNRPLTNAEHASLEGFVTAEAHARQLENAKISQPKVHDGVAAIARPVGVGEVSKVDADSGPKPSGDVNDPPAADKAKDQPSAKPPETPKPS